MTHSISEKRKKKSWTEITKIFSTCNKRFSRNVQRINNWQGRLRGKQMLSPSILTVCSDRLCDKILFFHRGGRKEGMGDIREHILTAKSMKDGCNDEERQDNSQVGKDVKGDPSTDDGWQDNEKETQLPPDFWNRSWFKHHKDIWD